MDKKRNSYRVLMGKAEEKTSLERSRRRWVDDVKMDLRGIGFGLRIRTSGRLL
jgi:hypothetical protein